MIVLWSHLKAILYDIQTSLRERFEIAISPLRFLERAIEYVGAFFFMMAIPMGILGFPTIICYMIWSHTWILITGMGVAAVLGATLFVGYHYDIMNGHQDMRTDVFDDRSYKFIRYSWLGRPNLVISVNPQDLTPEFAELPKFLRQRWYFKLKSLVEEPPHEEEKQSRFQNLGLRFKEIDYGHNGTSLTKEEKSS